MNSITKPKIRVLHKDDNSMGRPPSFKGWMTRPIFLADQNQCLTTYRSQIKVHTEQAM